MRPAPGTTTTGNDKKKWMMIGGGAGLLVLLLVIFFVVRGRGKDDKEVQIGPAAGAMRGGGFGAAMRSGESREEEEEIIIPQEPEEVIRYEGEPLPTRPDPFVSQPKPPAPPRKPPPPPPLPAVLIADKGIRVTGPAGISPTLRRTAGLIWNHDVYGLLQLGENMYIVRPGDTVSDYIVSAITRDSIILYSPALDQQIQVPLQGPFQRVPESMGPPPADLLGLGSQVEIGDEGADGGAVYGASANEEVPAWPSFPAQ